MPPRRASLLALPLGVAAVAVACAEELPPPENAGGTGAGTSGGAAGSSGSSGASGSGGSSGDAGCVCSPSNATGSCDTGSCVVVSCKSGFGDCDGKDDNGCEEALNVDGNCGACGRSCLGAACTAGACEAITLVSGLTDPWGVLVDDTHVYFSDFKDGFIDRASKVDGSGRTSLASGYPSTWFMVRDGGYIYFTTRAGQTVDRVLADGSAQAETFLSPGVKTSGLVIDSGTIYFTQSELAAFVWRAPKKKGATAVKLVTQQDTPLGIAVDDTNVYWGSGSNLGSGEVRRVKKNVSPETLSGQQVATSQGSVRGVLLDSKSVYWTSDDSGHGRVTRYNIATANVEALAVTEPAEYAVVDGKYIYWAASDDTAGHIYRLEKDYAPTAAPAPVVKLFSEAGAKPHDIAVDATALYFTDDGKGRVLKIAK